MSRPMRDSGVEWIGPVPEEWRVERLKNLFAFSKGLNITKADLSDKGVAVINYGQIHSKKNTGTHLSDSLVRHVPIRYLQSDPAAVLNDGDFVFADTSEDLEGLGNCVFVDEPREVMAGYHTIALRPHDKSNCKYLSYLFKSDAWRSQIRSVAYGIKVYSLTQRILRGCTVVLPPLSEQRAIAAYLDAKCGEVDAAVVAARQAVEDYKALKKSLVFETVTGKRGDVGRGERGEYGEQGGRGEEETTDFTDCEDCGVGDFNAAKNAKGAKSADGEGRAPARPNDDERSRESATLPATAGLARRPMRDSGVEWIGPVPEGWQMSRLRFLCSITTGDHNTQDANPDGQYPFYVRSPNVERSDDYTFEGPGILMAGDGAGAGRVFHLADGKYAVHQRVYLFYDFKEASAKYLWYYLGATFPFVMDKGSAQSTVPSVRLPMLMDHVVVFPDEQEQRAIAEWLDAKCGAIDALVAEQEALVADLERYRKSLIFECVTGKREVA